MTEPVRKRRRSRTDPGSPDSTEAADGPVSPGRDADTITAPAPAAVPAARHGAGAAAPAAELPAAEAEAEAEAAVAAAEPQAGTDGARLAELSYFFPAHNEEANLEGLVAEALEALPGLARRFEIVIVDDGSTDRTPELADALAAVHADLVRAVHHPRNLGYGAALRSGFRAARYERIGFTDGDRQFRVADLGRLVARLEAPDAPDVVVGYRLERADPLIRRLYARAYRLANRLFFGLRTRDVDCACKLFRREALEGVRVDSGGAFFTAELLVKLQAAGCRVAEVGVPHYPRQAGSPTGARPAVVGRAVRDFWALRLRLWAAPRRALHRGESMLG